METFKAPEGINFSSPEVAASLLAPALCRVASFLQGIEAYGAHLEKYDDWWEHDGLHFRKGEISLHQLFESVKSPQALLSVMPGDSAVHVGIMPTSHSWYLRFYTEWDESGFEILGRFDVTIPSNLADRLRQEIFPTMPLPLIETDAKAYFARIQMR
ncbi:hypothetical protein EON80_12960 [bacterium]|nr:MAG: hypothetical protein EON80_12960 [bacterium]